MTNDHRTQSHAPAQVGRKSTPQNGTLPAEADSSTAGGRTQPETGQSENEAEMKRGKVYPLKTTGEYVRFITIETTFGYARVTHSSGEMTHVLPGEIDDRVTVERDDFPPESEAES